MRFALVVLLASTALVGCSDDGTSPPPPSFTGSWSGFTAAEGFEITVSLTANEQDGAVTGNGVVSGELSGSSVSFAFTATGTHVHPQISLTLVFTDFEDANFSGSFANPDQVAGEINGSGFQNVALTLTRQ